MVRGGRCLEDDCYKGHFCLHNNGVVPTRVSLDRCGEVRRDNTAQRHGCGRTGQDAMQYEGIGLGGAGICCSERE